MIQSKLIVPTLLGVLAAAPLSANAADINVAGDQVYAQWSNPVFVGQLIDALTRQPIGVVDTQPTAVYDLGGSTAGSSATLTWGDFPDNPTPPPPSSTLTFNGNRIPTDGTKGSTAFELGTIAYTNGTSLNGSQIYGATLDLYANDPSLGLVSLGSEFVALTATVNEDGASDGQNADFANFAGTSTSFNVFEGATATGALWGTIVGDPQFVPSFVTIDNTGAGFLGADTAPGLPEPGVWSMMLLGVAAVGGGLRMARSKTDRAFGAA
jgi:hypothetical protein